MKEELKNHLTVEYPYDGYSRSGYYQRTLTIDFVELTIKTFLVTGREVFKLRCSSSISAEMSGWSKRLSQFTSKA